MFAAVLGLATVSAHAQPVDQPRLSPLEAEVSESDGRVVLTLSKETPGHIVYSTRNGSCTVASSGQQGWCRPAAHAPEDYASVSGEVTFTGAGAREITIPIADDELDEGMEFFEVEAHELTDTGGWAGSSTAIVRIVDDESPCWFPPCATDANGAADAATATTTAAVRPSTSPPAQTPQAPVSTQQAPPSPPPGPPPAEHIGAPPPVSPEVPVASASGELRPRRGFELPRGDAPEPVPGSTPGLAVGLGAAAMSVVAVAWVQRRERRSRKRA